MRVSQLKQESIMEHNCELDAKLDKILTLLTEEKELRLSVTPAEQSG